MFLASPALGRRDVTVGSQQGLEALQPGEPFRRLQRLHEAERNPVALAPGLEPDLLELPADAVEFSFASAAVSVVKSTFPYPARFTAKIAGLASAWLTWITPHVAWRTRCRHVGSGGMPHRPGSEVPCPSPERVFAGERV